MKDRLELFSELIEPAPVRRLRLAGEKRKAKLAERAALEQRVRNRQARENLITRHPELEPLFQELDQITIKDGGRLLRFVKAWIPADADSELRYQALHVIAATIIRLREDNGLSPMDDPIFDEGPSIFLVLQQVLDDKGEPGGSGRPS